MGSAFAERCKFVEIRQDGAIHYHRCSRCHDVLPSFDAPERTYRDCPASAGEPPQPAPAWRRFAAALWRWVYAGCPTPIGIEREARGSACNLCPLQQRRHRIEICAECKCWLPLKRRWLTEKCPAGRWPGGPHAHGKGLVMINDKLRASCGCGGAANTGGS